MPTTFAPGSVVGGYRLHRVLAAGDTAVVYEAAHLILPRRVAIKVLRVDLVAAGDAGQRLLEEACILEAFAHPGVGRVFDCGMLADGRPWIAMELVAGEALTEVLAQGGPVSIAVVMALLAATLEILVAAHRVGIVHRDLQPDNLRVLDLAGADVRVIDWGHARHPIGRAPRSMGAPAYVAPEQALGLASDGQTDVYALGVIAFEAVTGHPPFAAADALAMMFEPTPPLRTLRPDVPCCLAALIDDMLIKAQARRPTSAEVARRLAAMRPGAGVAAGCAHADAHHDYAEFQISLVSPEDVGADDVMPPGDAGAGDVVPASTWRARPWTPAPGPPAAGAPPGGLPASVQ